MTIPHDPDRLSRIETLRTRMVVAKGQDEPAVQARRQLVLLYHGSVYRYLLGMVRDTELAQELAQDFAVRFLRGDFQQANLERGRFRDYLKTALRNMVHDRWRRQKVEKQKGPRQLPEDVGEIAPESLANPATEAAFLDGLRDELLGRAWDALQRQEETTGKPHYTVLRCKTEQPQLRSAQLAELLGPKLGKPLTEAGTRQLIHRARDQFTDLLLEEAAQALATKTKEELVEELIELKLFEMCKAGLHRR